MRIVMASGEPFAFAGLWDAWRNPNGEVVRSCTIITTGANELLSPIHDRMPVILPRELESLWLDHDIQDYAALAGILTPYSTRRDGGIRSLLPGQLSRQRRAGSGRSCRAGRPG